MCSVIRPRDLLLQCCFWSKLGYRNLQRVTFQPCFVTTPARLNCFARLKLSLTARGTIPRDIFRNMSSDTPPSITTEQLMTIVENQRNLKENVMIIDVREIYEIEQTGVIPGGINIPLGELNSVLSLSPEDFRCRYQRAKPDLKTKIIFSCRSGARSLKAITIAKELGYTNLVNNSEGWLGYEKFTSNES